MANNSRRGRATVSTRYYGSKSPRGRGMWAFSIGNADGFKNPEKATYVYGTYSEAKKIAQDRARILGADIVYVLP